jgi:hypothetical protein
MTLAGDIALEAGRYHPDAIFVDAGNIGAAVVDRLRQLLPDVPVIEVWFGGKGRDAELEPGVTVPTADKRAEMWTRMRAWLRSGAVPDKDRLRDDLIGPTYAFAADDTREAGAQARHEEARPALARLGRCAGLHLCRAGHAARTA